MLVVYELSSIQSNRHAFKDWHHRNRGIIFEGPAPWEEVTPRLNYGACWLRIYKNALEKF